MSEPRRRRVPLRWVTLGEAVAVSAVLISALGLYNSWSKEAPAPVAAAPKAPATPLTLKATPSADADRLALAPLADSQVIQSQTIAFPTPLGIAPVETTGEARIEADWFKSPLDKARDAARRPHETVSDERLPVLLTTRIVGDGVERQDIAIYDLGYAVEGGGLFGGSKLRLRGLSLVARKPAGGQARIDALWRQRMAVAKPK